MTARAAAAAATSSIHNSVLILSELSPIEANVQGRGGSSHLDSLSSSTVVARADGFIEAEVDGEIVVLSIERGTCYGLNRVGSRIWGLISKPSHVHDLCTTL